VISKITIEHEDGQVVMVQFGPERKVGPFHVSDGKSSDTAQPSQRPQTGTEAGNTLMFIGARVGEVKNWSATNLPTSGVRNLTTGASLAAAVDMAVDNYTAAFERITERFDERAAAHGN